MERQEKIEKLLLAANLGAALMQGASIPPWVALKNAVRSHLHRDLRCILGALKL